MNLNNSPEELSEGKESNEGNKNEENSLKGVIGELSFSYLIKNSKIFQICFGSALLTMILGGILINLTLNE